jgi:hypothetical protein
MITHTAKMPIFGRGVPEMEEKRLANLRIANAKPRSPEHVAKLKAAFKTSWASGKRKKQSPEAWKKRAESVRKTYALGNYKKRSFEEMSKIGKENRKNVDYGKLCLANRILAEKRRGTEMPKTNKSGLPSRGCKSPNHWKSKYWSVERHDGIVLEGKNLNDLIRKNSHYFNPEDVEWKKSACRASAGLRQLFAGRVNGPKIWKGWSARYLP